jgi:hypothetical protein
MTIVMSDETREAGLSQHRLPTFNGQCFGQWGINRIEMFVEPTQRLEISWFRASDRKIHNHRTRRLVHAVSGRFH